MIGAGVGLVVLAGLGSWIFTQHAAISVLSEQNRALSEDTRELDRLRTEARELENLRNQEAELRQLREDNRDLLRLRSEVHRLRELEKEAEMLRAANARLLQAVQGFNLSSNQLSMVVAARKEGAILGVVVHPPGDAQGGGAARYKGAVVAQLDPAAPPGSTGLMVGDIIVRVDGRPIENPGQLQAEMLTKKPGDVVTLDVMRGDTLLRIPVPTRAWPK
jgi:hypothetical protein